MKAALLADYREDWIVDELADPTITAADDVIVRVGGAGFCRTDIHMWDGQFDEAWTAAGVGLPFVCGHENAGWIAEVGNGVKHLAVGDPVLLHGVVTCGYCHACRAGDDVHCVNSVLPGVFAPGGFAQYLKTNARACIPLPDGVTPLDVAPLACGGITAYRAVKKAQLLAYPGSSSIVIGAGGLGHIGIQCLRALTETEIIVVDRSTEALSHARGWGADHVVQSRDDGSHIAEITELTGGGAQVVIDFVGEHGAQNEAVQLLGANGTDFLVGYGGKLEVQILEQALFPETSFVGCILGNYNEMKELVALVRRGAVNVTRTTFPLEGVNDAFHALNEGRMIGRGVLVPNDA
jgi:NAD+-dependent secondary alcohol dehydrogenase Adh1